MSLMQTSEHIFCATYSCCLLCLPSCGCVEYDSHADTASTTKGAMTRAAKNQVVGVNTMANTTSATHKATKLLVCEPS